MTDAITRYVLDVLVQCRVFAGAGRAYYIDLPADLRDAIRAAHHARAMDAIPILQAFALQSPQLGTRKKVSDE